MPKEMQKLKINTAPCRIKLAMLALLRPSFDIAQQSYDCWFKTLVSCNLQIELL